MESEHSAGGIVVWKSRNGWKVLLMKDRAGNWTFPKGRIEQGETSEVAAMREIAEEVGVTDLTLITRLSPVSYWYFRGASIKKQVKYFLFQSKTQQKTTVQEEEGITDARWVPLAEARDMIGYPKTNLPLIEEVLHLL